MRMFDKVMKWYQRQMFYMAQAGNEIGKPLRFLTEYSIIILLIGSWGITVPIWVQIAIFIVLTLGAVLIGWFLLEKLHVLKYTTTLGNNHNPMLMEILTEVRKQKERLKKLEKRK